MRVSPDGDSVCFPAMYGQLYVSERGGPARQIGGPLPRITNCAWSPDGDEIWFSYAATGGTHSKLEAITPDGARRRALAALPTFARLYDVSPTGSMLVASGSLRFSVHGSASANSPERDLSIFDATRFAHLNAAGTHLLLGSMSTGSREKGRLWLRTMDGSAPVQCGDMTGLALSPDNARIAVLGDGSPFVFASNLITLMPTGTGEPRTIELPVEVQYSSGNQLGTHNWAVRTLEFSANGERLLLPFARDENGIERAYVHDLVDGWTLPVTPEGVTGPVVFAPDGRSVAYREPDGLYVYSIDDREARRLPGEPDAGMLARWSSNPRSLYLVEQDGAVATVYERSLETGQRVPVRTIRVPDPAGVTRFELWVSGNGEAYAYQLDRQLSNLFLLENVDQPDRAFHGRFLRQYNELRIQRANAIPSVLTDTRVILH